jgi:SAM-dependent methyltransferase
MSPDRDASERACPICAGPSSNVCDKQGKLIKRQFALFECGRCSFLFIADPSSDYSSIYDLAYYEGRGADPLVDYAFELEAPEVTIRKYEWAGLRKLVFELVADPAQLKWLDYGCGAGGFVRYLTKCGVNAFGTDTGGYVDKIVAANIPFISEPQLERHFVTFDVVTLIEVIEHVPDPVALLKVACSLLRTGGVLFLTTGNSEPHRSAISEWSYITPEIHISLFNPRCMRVALSAAGFEARLTGWFGWSDIIKFKVLKNVGAHKAYNLYDVLPWSLISRIVDRKYRVSALPYGIKA